VSCRNAGDLPAKSCCIIARRDARAEMSRLPRNGSSDRLPALVPGHGFGESACGADKLNCLELVVAAWFFEWRSRAVSRICQDDF
jgi:hypothetical protein